MQSRWEKATSQTVTGFDSRQPNVIIIQLLVKSEAVFMYYIRTTFGDKMTNGRENKFNFAFCSSFLYLFFDVFTRHKLR